MAEPLFLSFCLSLSVTFLRDQQPTLQLARVFKMARSWGSLRAIIQSLLKALPAMTSLTIMLALYMFIAAVAGMQMLGNFIPLE